MRKIKALLLITLLTLSCSLSLAAAPAFAATSASKTAACNALRQLDSTQSCDTQASKTVLSGLTFSIVNLLSAVIGVLAVIMIIVGGARYVASGGASDKVSGAKNTILYAVIGLIVALTAQFIVHFVVKRF